MQLENASIHAWLLKNSIKNEKGDLIEFKNHLFLYDIYSDQSDYLVCMKAAQVGMSTLEVLKNIYDAKRNKMDLIYTLPSDEDVQTFVGGKVNRIIAQNPILLEYTKDKDSIEQKAIGDSMIYFRGTWSKRAAIMVTADRLIHDEKDSSKQEIVSDYQARLQHSKYHQIHVFSHPSAPDFGVDVEWQQSDQKHWFIKCEKCEKEQYLSWPDSVDFKRREFICKHCHEILTNEDRRVGRWVKKYRDKKYSGYWISLLMATWISAGEIIDKFNDPKSTPDFFYNKVLGLPFAGTGNKLTWEKFAQNLTEQSYAPDAEERVVLGIDTGLKLDYVIGNDKGLFYTATATDYDELDHHMERWPKAIAVIDAGGDLIGSRKFFEHWRGRVFLCHLGADHKTLELLKWGKGEEYGNVVADRNRLIQLVVDEFGDNRLPVHGTTDAWHEYWLDWRNLTRIQVLDPVTGQSKGYKWVRSGRDHKALATAMWRAGMDKFGYGGAKIVGRELRVEAPYGPEIQPDDTVMPITQTGRHPVEATLEQLRKSEKHTS